MIEVAGKRVTVMGLGRFGGGVGVTRWLGAQGAEVLVTDVSPAEDLSESVASIDDLVRCGAVTLRLGGHNVSDFTTTDLVIANPAVPRPWENRFLRAAEAAGVPITTEIGLVIERLPSRDRTIGVTGSVGKSTTAAMIAHALGEVAGAGGVVLGGNIGGSLLGRLGDGEGAIGPETWVVLELSSAMLHWIERGAVAGGGGWSPHIAVVTNLAPNHLDWHGTLEHYTASKQHLLRHQRPGDTAVLGRSVLEWRGITPGATVEIDPAGFGGELGVPGGHNRANASAALLACRACGPMASEGRISAALRTFPGLAHRLQLIAEHAGIRFYNDSKSTTPDATLRAIEAIAAMPGMGAGRVHLIAGGYDKGIDLGPIAAGAGGLACTYTVGQTGAALTTAIRAKGGTAEFAQTVEDAVRAAMPRLRGGDALLLSPGCASWDQFTNFEARGELFIRCVRDGLAPIAASAGARQ